MSLAAVITRSQLDQENWRYTNLDTLLARPYTKAVSALRLAVADTQQQRLVFVNGIYQPTQSSLGQLPPDFLRQETERRHHLTLAGQSCLVTTPIELIFITDGEATEAATRLHIDIGASASLTLIERHIANGNTGADVMDVAITLAPQAKLVHDKILSGPRNGHIAHTQVDVGAGAYYRNFALIKDAQLVRNEIHVALKDQLAQCTLNGVMLLRALEHADTTVGVTHAAPHGISRQLYKTILADRARGVFQGRITVAEGAQKTDGRQLSRALLLSDQAEMDAKPELKIYADDVSCSHGSTVGDLDTEALFYLRTRGLSEEAARALLLRAFVGDVIDDTPSVDEREAIYAEADRWFNELSH